MAAKKTNNTDDRKMSLEEAFKALDDLIELMGDENITLEDSFNDYKKGLELIRFCNESIGRIEGELEILENQEN